MKSACSAVILLALTLSLATGCKTTGADSSKVVDSIVDTRVEIVKAQNDLTDTLMALDGLQSATGDVKPAYDKFKTALAATESQKAKAEKRATEMRINQAEYQKKWEEEAAGINNPDLKTSAEQRAAHVQNSYGTIRDIALDCRQKYAVLYTDLLDINQYLKSDLNAAAIEKAKPTIANARKDGEALNSRLNDLVAQMNALTAEMNPAGTVPEK